LIGGTTRSRETAGNAGEEVVISANAGNVETAASCDVSTAHEGVDTRLLDGLFQQVDLEVVENRKKRGNTNSTRRETANLRVGQTCQCGDGEDRVTHSCWLIKNHVGIIAR